MGKMLTLTLLPTLALLIMSIVDVRDTAYKNVANTAIRDVVILSTEVTHALTHSNELATN